MSMAETAVGEANARTTTAEATEGKFPVSTIYNYQDPTTCF